MTYDEERSSSISEDEVNIIKELSYDSDEDVNIVEESSEKLSE